MAGAAEGYRFSTASPAKQADPRSFFYIVPGKIHPDPHLHSYDLNSITKHYYRRNQASVRRFIDRFYLSLFEPSNILCYVCVRGTLARFSTVKPTNAFALKRQNIPAATGISARLKRCACECPPPENVAVKRIVGTQISGDPEGLLKLVHPV